MIKRILAIAHHKGGVGKTTTALNVGYALAVAGYRVGLVDLDPQANLSRRLGWPPQRPPHPTLGEALLDSGVVPEPVACTWGEITVDLLPGTLDMAGVELRLTALHAREQRLGAALAALEQRDGAYDFLLLDCPPSLSVLTQNALYAADGVLVPVQAQDEAYQALDSLLGIIQDVNRFRRTPLELLGFLATMVDPRTVMSRQIVDALHANYDGAVFTSTIPDLTLAQYEGRYQAPVTQYAPDNPVALAYLALAKEVAARA